MATQASDTANNTASKRARGASPDELAVIAQRAQAFTNASGVAIALSEGSADEIICRARSGASAPDVGAALRVEGTFTGLCIQSGKELRCDDCETDTRVDTAAIRALNIRSMVVTPIREENRVIGVLAVFAPTAHAFTITHVAVLKTMADQISALLQRQRNLRDEIQPMPSPVSAGPTAVAKPAIAPQAPTTPPPVVIKPAAVAPAPARGHAPVAKAEPVKAPMPLEVVPLAVPPKKEEKRAEAPQASFGTFDSVAGDDKKPGNKLMLVGIVAVLLIAAAATFAFLKMQKPGAAAPASHPQEAASNPPAASGNPQAALAGSPTNTVAANVTVPAVTAKPASESDKKPAAKTGDKAASEKPTPAEKPVAVATLAGNGPSRIAQTNASQTPDVVPAFTVEGGSAPNLSTLARPATSAVPTAAIEQSQLEPLQLVRTVPPVYPPIAKARSITGAVEVEVKVDKNGRPSSPKFISGPPVFKDAAFEAVMKYQFKPAKLNGQPIEQLTRVKMVFK